jgi:hypothetical protein
MAYATPPNFTTGAIVTESQLDALSDDIAFLANPPKCRVYNSVAISIPNAVETALTFNSEVHDTDTMHSTSVNTGRVTITTSGTFEIGFHVGFAAGGGGTTRYAYVRRNGGAGALAYHRTSGSTGIAVFGQTTAYPLTAGDYLEVVVYQDSGGALNVDTAAIAPTLWATWRSL